MVGNAGNAHHLACIRSVGTKRDRVHIRVSRVVRGGKRDAEKRLSELLSEVSAGRHTGTKAFGTLLDSWMEQQERLGRCPVTLRNLQSCVEAILRPGLGRIELRKLRAADLDRFHTREAKCGKAPSTIRRYHSHIAAASAYLACVAGDLCSGGRPHTRYEVEAL